MKVQHSLFTPLRCEPPAIDTLDEATSHTICLSVDAWALAIMATGCIQAILSTISRVPFVSVLGFDGVDGTVIERETEKSCV